MAVPIISVAQSVQFDGDEIGVPEPAGAPNVPGFSTGVCQEIKAPWQGQDVATTGPAEFAAQRGTEGTSTVNGPGPLALS